MTEKILIEGHPVIRVWESFHGWYWFATEKADEDRYFGLVRGFETEWGYWSARELKANAPYVWDVPRKNWRYCPLVEVGKE